MMTSAGIIFIVVDRSDPATGCVNRFPGFETPVLIVFRKLFFYVYCLLGISVRFVLTRLFTLAQRRNRMSICCFGANSLILCKLILETLLV
jgi:hypothetical protein